MDKTTCEQADILIMKHMEQTITPDEAGQLHHHVSECANCREYYLNFDEVLEYAASDNTLWIEAPADFTTKVMKEVTKISTIQQVSQVAETRSYKLLHFLWGGAAIMLGVAMFFVYNPEHFSRLADSLPFLATASAWVSTAWFWISSGMDRIMQNHQTIEGSVGIAALLIALVIGILLVVLHRDQEVSQ